MKANLIPTIPGQVCKIVSAGPDMEETEVYIVTDDPAEFEEDDEILIVSLTSIQRNIYNPESAEHLPVKKNELVVVANNLESYVQSWNKK